MQRSLERSSRKAASKRLVVMAVAIGAIGVILSAALTVILRYQPPRALAVTRKLFGRVLNPVLLGISARLGVDQSVVYHVGRRSGREYATPLCVVEVSDGFIVPAAFGPDVDWLRNLRTTPRAKLAHDGILRNVDATVIDRDEAYRLAGGTAGCPCWDQFRIESYALLRPFDRVGAPESAADIAGLEHAGRADR